MIEKVAVAIAAQHGVSSDPYRIVGHGDFAHFYWTEFTDHAVAAIEAMGNPTTDMEDAGFDAGHEGDGEWIYADPMKTYRAMIGKALEE